MIGTVILLITVIVLLFWLYRTTLQRDLLHDANDLAARRIMRLEKQVERKQRLINEHVLKLAETTQQRDEALSTIAHKNRQLKGHIVDQTILVAEIAWWREGGKVEDELSAANVIGQIETWLEGEVTQ